MNVVEAESAVGFRDILNKYPLNIPSSEIFKKLVKPEGFKVHYFSLFLFVPYSTSFLGLKQYDVFS